MQQPHQPVCLVAGDERHARERQFQRYGAGGGKRGVCFAESLPFPLVIEDDLRLVGPTLGGPADPSVPHSVPDAPTTPDLIVDLSVPRVSITSAFQGESILMFGTFDPPGEIVVVVAGPAARETVLRKQRVLGLWLNTGRESFDDVPAYYAIAASQPLQRLLARSAGGEILSLEDRLASVKPVGARPAPQLAQFRSGLIEVKRREGLYPAAIGSSAFLLSCPHAASISLPRDFLT